MAAEPWSFSPRKLWGRDGREDGVHGGRQITVRGVLEAHGRGQAAGHLPVGLGFGGPGPDGRPTDEVADVLGRVGVQGLGGRGQAELADAEQELPGLPHAFLDMEGIVHAGVVDEPLPARGGARLLEVDPHHQQQRVGDLVRQRLEPPRVVEARHRIVDAARPHHHHEAGVLPGQDALQVPAAAGHSLGHGVRDGQGRVDLRRGGHAVERINVEVLERLVGHGWGLSEEKEKPRFLGRIGVVSGMFQDSGWTLAVPRTIRVREPIIGMEAGGHGRSRVFHPGPGKLDRQGADRSGCGQDGPPGVQLPDLPSMVFF